MSLLHTFRSRLARLLAIGLSIFAVLGGLASAASPALAAREVAQVKVGPSPDALDVNPFTNRVYVASLSNNTLTVVDGGTNTVLTKIEVAKSPIAVIVDSARNRVYVAGSRGGLSIVDGASDQVLQTIQVAPDITAMAFNPRTNTVFLANGGENQVTILDGATLATSTVSVGDYPDTLGIAWTTNTLVVGSGLSANVALIDATTGATKLNLVTTVSPTYVVVDQPSGVAFALGGTEVYELDTRSDRVTSIAVGCCVLGVALNEATQKLYASSALANTIDVIDLTRGNQLTTIPAGAFPETIAVDSRSNQFFVTNFGDPGQILIFDGATNVQKATEKLGAAPYVLADDPRRQQLDVANESGNSVAVINTSN